MERQDTHLLPLSCPWSQAKITAIEGRVQQKLSVHGRGEGNLLVPGTCTDTNYRSANTEERKEIIPPKINHW